MDLQLGGEARQPGATQDHDVGAVLAHAGGAALGQQRHGGLRIARDVGAGRRHGAHGGEPRGETVACHELLEHRLPALAAGHDGEALAERAGLQDRGISHADHWLVAHLLERREPGIAEAGQHDGILAAAVVGERIERRMTGDGIGRARGDVARAEGAGERAQFRVGAREAFGRLQDEVGDRLRGVGIDQQDVGHSASLPAAARRDSSRRSTSRRCARCGSAAGRSPPPRH